MRFSVQAINIHQCTEQKINHGGFSRPESIPDSVQILYSCIPTESAMVRLFVRWFIFQYSERILRFVLRIALPPVLQRLPRRRSPACCIQHGTQQTGAPQKKSPGQARALTQSSLQKHLEPLPLPGKSSQHPHPNGPRFSSPSTHKAFHSTEASSPQTHDVPH